MYSITNENENTEMPLVSCGSSNMGVMPPVLPFTIRNTSSITTGKPRQKQ